MNRYENNEQRRRRHDQIDGRSEFDVEHAQSAVARRHRLTRHADALSAIDVRGVAQLQCADLQSIQLGAACHQIDTRTTRILYRHSDVGSHLVQHFAAFQSERARKPER
jgi:hypothetical protein